MIIFQTLTTKILLIKFVLLYPIIHNLEQRINWIYPNPVKLYLHQNNHGSWITQTVILTITSNIAMFMFKNILFKYSHNPDSKNIPLMCEHASHPCKFSLKSRVVYQIELSQNSFYSPHILLFYSIGKLTKSYLSNWA